MLHGASDRRPMTGKGLYKKKEKKSEILKQNLENAKFLIFDFFLLHLPVMQHSYFTLNIMNNGKM